MPTLPRPNPSRDITSLRNEMDRLSADNVIGPRAPWDWEGEEVHLDVYEEGTNLMVKASVPAVTPEDMKVDLQNDVLTISGEVNKDEEHSDHDYYVRERRYGSFSRSLELPRAVNADKADAVFENGVLTITLPKADKARGNQIPIRAK
jgi:HSP20 family protein